MKRQHTYTSTMPAPLLKMLATYSEKLKISKTKFIEKAVENYIHEIKRNEYAESFKRAKGDKEMRELSEMGIGDFLKMLDRL